jgi:hypothetical protein
MIRVRQGFVKRWNDMAAAVLGWDDDEPVEDLPPFPLTTLSEPRMRELITFGIMAKTYSARVAPSPVQL